MLNFVVYVNEEMCIDHPVTRSSFQVKLLIAKDETPGIPGKKIWSEAT